jgi:hypothetical protein
MEHFTTFKVGGGRHATCGAYRNRNYSGYLVPTNADIPKLDVFLFVAVSAVSLIIG